MQYKEFRDYVLQLLNMYTARGSEFTEQYNDQADFLARIPGLYNAAMLELAAEASPLIGVMHPSDEDVADIGGSYVAVKVPDDFLSMTGDGIPVMSRDGRPMRIKGYYMSGTGTVMVRKDLYQNGILEYHRVPKRLNIDYQAVDEDTELDGTAEMQTAAAYYAASMLMMQEDAFVYAALRNEYDDKLSQMKKRLRAEVFFVDDVIAPDCYNVY